MPSSALTHLMNINIEQDEVHDYINRDIDDDSGRGFKRNQVFMNSVTTGSLHDGPDTTWRFWRGKCQCGPGAVQPGTRGLGLFVHFAGPIPK